MRATTSTTSVSARVIDEIRVLVVAGIAVGAVVVGGGGRLAMMVLRLSSSERVHGVTSDDGFIIGRVTLGGTYNLLHIGAAVGLIGAGAYRLVAPWLIGPSWFRRSTTAAAAGAVVGSMLLHADGVDFTLLTPTWLAVGLFIGLPALFGMAIGVAVDRFARPGSWIASGRRRWALPIVLTACFPGTMLVIPVLATTVTACVAGQQSIRLMRVRSSTTYGFGVRLVWSSIAIAGLVAVVRDVQAIV